MALASDGTRVGFQKELLRYLKVRMVGTIGLEPTTSSVSGKRSNQLNYAPAMRENMV